jgi:Putative transposase/Transposase zinc-binding domain
MVFQYLERHLLAVVAKSPSKSGAQYLRHRPEQTALYQLIQQHAATYFAQAQDATGSSLPRYVKDEFDSFLSCGILAHGFLRLHCGGCKQDQLLAFSCKRRGLLAAQPNVVTTVLQVVQRKITLHLLQRANLNPTQAQGGSVTLIQRFGSAANLNIHLHCLVLDGVYRIKSSGELEFIQIPAPTDQALRLLLCSIIASIMKRLVRQGVLVQEQDQWYVADDIARLCRYITRPALANDRVKINAKGQVELKLKTPWRDGTTHHVMSPLEFMQRQPTAKSHLNKVGQRAWVGPNY